MPISIDWEGLVVGFESRSNKITHFFDRQTGDVVQILERDADQHAAFAADPRYLALPRDQGERTRGDLDEFAAHCADEKCRADLERALAEEEFASAYRSALLRYPKEETHFFQFKERRARERATDWLVAQGILRRPAPQ